MIRNKGAMVYHYCDLNAFINIIKTRKLWLSDVKKSNDSIEGKYLALLMLQSLNNGMKFGFYDDKIYEEASVLEAEKIFNSFLNNKSFRKYIPKGYTIDSLEKIEKEIEQIAERRIAEKDLSELEMGEVKKIESDLLGDEDDFPAMPGEEYYCDKFETPIYTTCFSENGDLLSQWRGYAADGTGIAIGFRKDILNKWHLIDNPNFRCDFTNVEYDFKKTWEYACKSTNKVLDLIEKKNRYKQVTRKINAMGEVERTLNDILSYSPYFKQESFSEEMEYRLIFTNGVSMIDGEIFIDSQSVEHVNSQISNFELGELKYRVTKDNICSYYELSFSNVANDLIGEIVIGPKSRTTTADVEFILSTYGYNPTKIDDLYDQRCVYIRRSSLSYR